MQYTCAVTVAVAADEPAAGFGALYVLVVMPY